MSTLAENERAVRGHNSPTGERIRSFLERGQRLAEDAKAVREDTKEMWLEAKGEGYDVKTLKLLLKLMGEDKVKREEAEALLSLYADEAGVEI